MQNKNNILLRSVKSIKKSDIILFIMDFLHHLYLNNNHHLVKYN